MEPGSNSRIFTWLVLFSQVLALSVVVMVAVWMGHYRGGFSWSSASLVFNYHPLFMVIGMIFLNGDALLAYRVFRNTKKLYVKIIHASLHVGALLFASVGLKAVFDYHNLNHFPNLYSLHSWLGLITVILFGTQWLFGFVTFLFPKASEGFRRSIMPYHVYLGLGIFCLSLIVALMGITEKAIFSLNGEASSPKYSSYPPEGLLANFLGLTLMILGGTVGYIVTRPEFKRPPSSEEEHMSLTHE